MGETFFTELDYFINPNCTNNVISKPNNINLREFVEHRLNPFNIQPTRKYRISNLDNESYDYLQFLSNDLVQLNKILAKNIKQARRIKRDLQSTYGIWYDLNHIKERRFKTKLTGYSAVVYKKYVFVVPRYISYIEKLKYSSLVANTMISIAKNKNISRIISNNKFESEDASFLKEDIINLLDKDYYENYVTNILQFIKFSKTIGISNT
jgi:hypothetical protein